MATLYDDLIAAGCETDSHESDLYVADTPEARDIMHKHGTTGQPFRSNVDGRIWLDVPFEFSPFWRKRGFA